MLHTLEFANNLRKYKAYGYWMNLCRPIEHVRSTHLQEIAFHDVSDADMRKIFQNCPQLESLTIFDATKVSVETFQQCPLGIREIKLENTPNLSDRKFAQFIRRCANLREFECIETNLGDCTFQAVVSHRNIDMIWMSKSRCTGKFTHLLANCPFLTRACIFKCPIKDLRSIFRYCRYLRNIYIDWADLDVYREIHEATSLRYAAIRRVEWNVLEDFPLPTVCYIRADGGFISSHIHQIAIQQKLIQLNDCVVVNY